MIYFSLMKQHKKYGYQRGGFEIELSKVQISRFLENISKKGLDASAYTYDRVLTKSEFEILVDVIICKELKWSESFEYVLCLSQFRETGERIAIIGRGIANQSRYYMVLSELDAKERELSIGRELLPSQLDRLWNNRKKYRRFHIDRRIYTYTLGKIDHSEFEFDAQELDDFRNLWIKG